MRSASTLIGQHPSVQHARSLVEKYAGSGLPVLISGETGTGKSLVARLLHDLGPSSRRAFVTVSCPAVCSSLFESEVFGSRRGAYTGASEDRRGLVEAADGGTLFLDEISDLPIEHQAKLLYLIESRCFRPVGAASESRSTARIVAASNQDLDAFVQAGRFRSDLFYRLNVLCIQIPPLRDRLSDVPLLVEHIASRIAPDRAPRFAARAIDQLTTYEWPGNVRELEHVVHRSLVHAEAGPVTDFELGARAQKAGRRFRIFPWQLRELLERSNGRLQPVADELGVSVRTIQRRLKELGVERKRPRPPSVRPTAMRDRPLRDGERR